MQSLEFGERVRHGNRAAAHPGDPSRPRLSALCAGAGRCLTQRRGTTTMRRCATTSAGDARCMPCRVKVALLSGTGPFVDELLSAAPHQQSACSLMLPVAIRVSTMSRRNTVLASIMVMVVKTAACGACAGIRACTMAVSLQRGPRSQTSSPRRCLRMLRPGPVRTGCSA